MEYNEDEFHCSLAVDLKRVVDKIVIKINRVRPCKFGVSHSDIINYMLGHGDLAFNFRDEKGLRRGELIGNLSDEESRDLIEWCFNKLGSNLI